MRSPKQIEASRINGRRTHGPVTPQGKYNSSRNNLRHGLLAQTVVLERESEERFLELLDEYMQAHQPQSVTEAALVETMVVARWRHMRILGMQKLALDRDIAVQDPELGPSSVRAMYALRGSPDNPPRPDVLLRYEVTYDRMFKSALRHLESLVRHRKPSVGPYFPAHPSGHNWKPEGCGADLQEEQEPASAALRFGRFNNKKDEPEPTPEDHGAEDSDSAASRLARASQKREGCGADLQADQETESAALRFARVNKQARDRQGAGLPTASQPPNAEQQPPRQKIPHTIRPQEVVETKTRQKDSHTPKRQRTEPFRSSPPKRVHPRS